MSNYPPFKAQAIPTVKTVETYRRDLGYVVTQHHHGFYGAVSIQGTYHRCGHFHQKPGPARACAARLGRRLARQLPEEP